MRNHFGIALAVLISCVALPSNAKDFDLVVRGARIVDGTGAPAFHGDVAVEDGRIAAVGWIGEPGEIKADREIDGTGLVLAPGFIDVHTHAEDVVDQPSAENFAQMGVTTVLMGNCGSSETDLEAFFRRLKRARPAINVATLIGHNSVRRRVMGGSFDREPSPEELDKMKKLVAQGMRDGAFGFSTGLIYLPGTFTKTGEIIELARIASAHGGIYASHMRDEGLQIESALRELFQISREANIRAHVSHLKLSGKSAWHKTREVLAMIDQARAEGLDITQDQYAYTASSTGISQLVPEWAREGGKLKERLADPDQKERMTLEMRAKLKRRGEPDFSYAVIAHCKKQPELNGLNIAQAAERERGDASLDNQIELILKIVSEGSPAGVFHGMSEEDLADFMRHPNTMAASDSGIRKFGEGVPHPRGYGNNARILGKYVREEGVLRLEEAVRKMTSLPAGAFGFKGRGIIREGAWADLVLFDPKTVVDQATYTQPHQYPAAIKMVLVNGVVAVEEGKMTGNRGGKGIRFNKQ